jgi:hypothetical protein
MYLEPLDEYKLSEVLEATQVELVKLTEERERIERRMNKLQNDIVHLAALCRVEVEDPIKQLGLTDAVRYIFSREARPLDKPEVVAILEQSYDVSGYKNLLANVHTIVRRLIKSGEIKRFPEIPRTPGKIGEDKGKYVWSGRSLSPPPPSRLSAAKTKTTKTFLIEDGS